jgi:hypothetical protein
VLLQIFQMVFFPDSSKSNLLCCCNRFHVLSVWKKSHLEYL